MDIGNDGSIDWAGPVGNLTGGKTIGGPEGLATKLQAIVASAGPGPGNVVIPFNFASEREGRLEVSNVTVLTAQPIPNTFYLDEDTDAIGLIDLDGYFPIVGGPASLNYSVSFEQNASRLHAVIGADGHSLSFFTPTEDWWGAMTFRVRATDAKSHSYESNTFNVSVRPLNDRPVIPPVPAQVATQGTPFHLKVAASDADIPYDTMESLTFSDNSSMFAIDPKAGTIDFTPTNADLGPHAITVYVSDRMGANASVAFALTVNNTNDGPTIDPIGDKDVKVPEYLSFTVTAHDLDAPYGDTLTFSDDTPLFDIDGKTGMVFFSAIGFQVGRYVITITVTDSHAASASATFNLSVRNFAGTFNRAPAITPTGDITATEDVPFNLAISASDPDGDMLRLSDDTDLFAIDPVTGVISFTPTNADVGTYLVGITVVDPEGLHASFALNLTVLNVNDPPNATILAPKSGAVVDSGDTVLLQGMGEDIDAGDILNFTWYDKDLLLGYGPNLTVADIGPGDHIVMLVVRDSAGVNATAYVDFRVNESPGLKPTAKPIIGREAAVAMSTIGIFSLALALFVAGTEVGKFKFIQFLLPLYSKIQGDAILDKYIRGKIHGYICANPGSHYSLIKQDLDVHNGTLTHHLTMLEKSGFVCSSSDGFYKRFYPSKMPIPQGKFYPNPLQTSMLTVIDKHPGISQSDLAREMNLRRQIVNYHIHILSDFGIVDVRKDGKASRVFKKGHEPGTGPSTDMEIVGGDQPEEGGFVELELDEAGNRPEEK